MALPCLAPAPEGVYLQLLVQPRASRNAIVGMQDDELKVRLTSPPVEGAANKLCCAFFAKLCGVSKSSVSIVSGDKSRHKRLLIEGVSLQQVENLLTPHL